MSVEYIARLTCECGAKVECVAYATYRTHGYGGCEAELECDEPSDWLSKGDLHKCPACVQRWQDEPKAGDLWGRLAAKGGE